MLDPETGIGAWKIAGGMNGAYVKVILNRLLSILGAGLKLLNKISPPGWGAIIAAIANIVDVWDECSGANLVEAIAIIVIMAMVAFVATEAILIMAVASGPYAPLIAIAGFALLYRLLHDVNQSIDHVCEG